MSERREINCLGLQTFSISTALLRQIPYFKTIFEYAHSNNYRVMFYDQYEAIHLEGFTSNFGRQLSIEDVVSSANQVGFDLTQLYFYVCQARLFRNTQFYSFRRRTHSECFRISTLVGSRA